MKDFQLTASTIAGQVAELMLQNIDVTSSIQKMAGKPTVIVYVWGVRESYTVTDGVKSEIKVSRDIIKSFYVDSDKEIQPCIDYLQGLSPIVAYDPKVELHENNQQDYELMQTNPEEYNYNLK